MRLINTKTLALSEFFGSEIPRYAILSHTWGREEITYQEWTRWQETGDISVSRRAGFLKIKGACLQARRDNLDWVWVDTNCIDKTSSSELTEAINSMYIWYRNSHICYAFLADVPHLSDDIDDPFRQFRSSKWFTRGWTLQELLAPKRLEFYTSTWSRIGSKSGSLIQVIHETTDIDVPYLSGLTDITMASVAKKMSWLAKRTTTRVEDLAYCMLGIFEINLPLLYGEGMQAFMRLQNEIVRQVYDHTIFCWTWTHEVPHSWVSMLAPSPRMFRDSGDYVQRKRSGSMAHYSTTNLGLLMNLPVIYTLGFHLFVVLDAGLSRYSHDKRACIPLRRPEDQSMVLERVYFPPIALNLPLNTPQKMVRYSMYVSSRPTPSTLKTQPKIRGPQFGVLLFLEPTVDAIMPVIRNVNHAGSGLLDNQPLLTDGFYITTHPPRMYDGSRGLLMVPSVSDGLRMRHALTVEVRLSSVGHTSEEDSNTYYLYFEVESSRRPRWHCYLTTRKQLERRRDWVRVDKAESLRLPGDDWSSGDEWYEEESIVDDVDCYLRNKFANIWKSGNYYGRHESSEGLRIAVGQRLNIYPDVEIRPCVLSGSKDVSIRLHDSDDSGGAEASDNDSNCARAYG